MRGSRSKSDRLLTLIFRPEIFRNNARVTDFSPRYRKIAMPVQIITGDSDDVVLLEIHSVDIEGTKLTVLPGVGHKPDYVATDVVVKATRAVVSQVLER